MSYILLSNCALKPSNIFVLYLESIPLAKAILSKALSYAVYLLFAFFCFKNTNL
jgi:hypothetical protein